MKENVQISLPMPYRQAWTHSGSESSRTFRAWHVTALVASGIAGAPGCGPTEGALGGRQFYDPVRAEGFPISYFASGNQEAQRVIFVHGTPGNAGAWSSFITDDPLEFEYLAVDRPGFGNSNSEGAVVKLSDQAAALEPFLVERNGRWPILVGHSLGAPIIAKLAALHKDRVGGLVFVSGSFDPDLEKIHFMQRVGRMWPLERALPLSIRNSNLELFALKEELEHLLEHLNEITAPIAIVHGTKDNLVPYSNVAYLQPRLTKAQSVTLVRLDERNHFLPWNSKQEIVGVLKDLAGSHSDIESQR